MLNSSYRVFSPNNMGGFTAKKRAKVALMKRKLALIFFVVLFIDDVV